MKRRLMLALLLGPVLAGCASVPVPPAIQDTEIINAPFDKVWSAIVGTLAEQSLPIQSIDKASGLVTTQFVVFANGILAQRAIDKVAVKPSSLLYTWSGGRYMLSIFVTKSGENQTRVKITTHIEAFENNVTYSWMICYSNGTIENQLFNAIKAKI
ncbi:MAG: hypothetical protein M1470_02945 [Bacteroidetes bacterium]|nr:hypothetical protein [Bacteroidota bacterium]MCL5739232.1 hypothetical protein [Bacteroidota bacterium]